MFSVCVCLSGPGDKQRRDGGGDGAEFRRADGSDEEVVDDVLVFTNTPEPSTALVPDLMSPELMVWRKVRDCFH